MSVTQEEVNKLLKEYGFTRSRRVTVLRKYNGKWMVRKPTKPDNESIMEKAVEGDNTIIGWYSRDIDK